MNTHAGRTQEPKNRTTQNSFSQSHQNTGANFQIADNRPETVVQRKLSEMANNNHQVPQLKSFQKKANRNRLNVNRSSMLKNQPVQRMIDKDNISPINNLTELNNALFKLNPQITGVSLSMFQTPGATLSMLNQAISQNYLVLYNGIKRSDIVNALKAPLATLVNTHPVTAYNYDTHGDKHFPGGTPGTKFSAGSNVVNPQLIALIQPNVGRIRRDAKGKNQSYYLTTTGIPQCGGKDLTIQVDFDFESDTITYHGYPDDNVINYSLSRTKNGAAIP